MFPAVPKQVLLVDDDEDFVFLVQRALTGLGAFYINSVLNGAEAIRYVSGMPPFRNREMFPLPDLIFADLHMAGIDGFHLIEWLQQNRPYNEISMVVLSGTANDSDVKRIQDLGVGLFYRKPHTTRELDTIMKEVLQLWRQGILAH